VAEILFVVDSPKAVLEVARAVAQVCARHQFWVLRQIMAGLA